MERFLLVQRRSLGDALFTATVAEVLKKEFPRSEVHLLTLPFAVEFFENYLYLDKVFPYRGLVKTLKDLRRFEYTAVLDYEATFRTYPLVFFLKGERKLAFYRNSREAKLGFIYTDLVKAENFGFTFWDRLKLLEPLGVDYKRYIEGKFKPSFPTRGKEKKEIPYKDYVVLCPKGVLRNKEIHPRKAILLASELQRETGKVVVLAVEPKEVSYLSELRTAMEDLGEEFPVFSQDLNGFLALVKNSRGVVTVESFPYHLALLLGKPSVVIVQGYGIWYRESFGLIEPYYPPLDCVPCFKRNKCPRGDFACTFEIDEKEIAQMASRLFG